MQELLSIPAIIAVVEVVKRAGMPSRFAPLLSAVLGITFGLLLDLSVTGGAVGLLFGLSASGLYSSKVLINK